MLYTDSEPGREYHIPLTNYSAAAAEPLLTGQIPDMIPIKLCVTNDGVDQVYSIDGLTGYKSAISGADVPQMLAMLKGLCDNTITYPILMDENLGLLAEDRLFWEPGETRWRYLMLIADSEAWRALPSRTPDEIWSALFVAAMDSSEAARESLQNIVDGMAEKDFSVEELSRAIEVEMRRQEAEGAAGKTGAAQEKPLAGEEEEEEFRPWETDRTQFKSDIELALTGPTAEEIITSDREAKAEAVGAVPIQPVIPGIAPPPPPVRRSESPEPETEMAGSGTATTVLLKPETCVLDVMEPPGQPVMKAEVAKIRIPRVSRMETQEMAYVDRPYFVIGSKAGVVDFLIRNNRVISRRHAAIITKGTDYYLVDLGSRNGVFVGGKRLPKDQETLIYIGDVFSLANEKFMLQW